ncbi:MAG: hypothetical protein VKL42_01740 [Snowella sp.]|nr:hypothetical protein [Snowella sp.]
MTDPKISMVINPAAYTLGAIERQSAGLELFNECNMVAYLDGDEGLIIIAENNAE